ncbi:hypothetical protein ACCO45_005795 [Purpureocillium lilacinum]|uniref:Uncharacterized protein n=1 Tax=Purpureocillium lilacinum TaxID=33203 RepID=A0ACC4DXC7_PURLI
MHPSSMVRRRGTGVEPQRSTSTAAGLQRPHLPAASTVPDVPPCFPPSHPPPSSSPPPPPPPAYLNHHRCRLRKPPTTTDTSAWARLLLQPSPSVVSFPTRPHLQPPFTPGAVPLVHHRFAVVVARRRGRRLTRANFVFVTLFSVRRRPTSDIPPPRVFPSPIRPIPRP